MVTLPVSPSATARETFIFENPSFKPLLNTTAITIAFANTINKSTRTQETIKIPALHMLHASHWFKLDLMQSVDVLCEQNKGTPQNSL